MTSGAFSTVHKLKINEELSCFYPDVTVMGGDGARRRIYNAFITKNVVSHPGLEEFAKAKRRTRAARAVVEAARKENRCKD